MVALGVCGLWRKAVWGLAALAAVGFGCRNGSVTFTIHTPSRPELNPLADPTQVSEFALSADDGTLLGATSQNSKTNRLDLGDLTVSGQPMDVILSVLSGSQLLGMAQVSNVSIQHGSDHAYVADVRRPLVFVGSAPPSEALTSMLAPAEIRDPTNEVNLSGSRGPDMTLPPLVLPDNTRAVAVTSDGRTVAAAHDQTISWIDTGSWSALGDTALPFTPARLLVGPHNGALIALPAADGGGGGGGTMALFPAVSQVVANPATLPVAVALGGLLPRSAAFSRDGKIVYVLGGRDADPCNGDAPPPNAVVAVKLDSTVAATWNLPTFASDLAVDPTTGNILLSDALSGQVVALDPNAPSGAVSLAPLMPVSCPSSLRVVNNQLLVVAEGAANIPSISAGSAGTAGLKQFVLGLFDLKTKATRFIPFTGPRYEKIINVVSTSDNNTNINLQLQAVSLTSEQLTATPNGTNAIFSVRVRYLENNQNFWFVPNLSCNANIEVIEYGIYAMDLRTGTATYESRSQQLLMPALNQPCIECMSKALNLDLQIFCPATAGDRAGELSVIFGGP